jgi:NitT/TauT family transport system substrate-binding protein
MRKRWQQAAVALAILAASSTGAAAQSNKVVVAQGTDSLIFLPAYVAKAKNYFADEGLDGEIKIFRGGVQALAGVMSGDAHVYLGPPSTAMKAIIKGQDLKVYGALMDQIPTNIVIQGNVARKVNISSASPITDKIAALKGLTLGVNAAGSAPDQVLRYTLRTAGLDPDRDAKISPVGAGSALIAQFEQKRIDGFAFSSPASDIAVERFGGVMVINFAKGEYDPLRGFLYLGLISREDWLKENPDRSARVVNAFWRALKLIKEKPDEARAAVRTFFPKMNEDDFNAGFAANALAMPAMPEVKRRSVELNREFSKVVEGIDLDLDPAKVFTNDYVNAAAKLPK